MRVQILPMLGTRQMAASACLGLGHWDSNLDKVVAKNPRKIHLFFFRHILQLRVR
jgi:hypothetical protein